MDYEIALDGNRLDVSLSGRLDALTAPQFDEAISKSLDDSLDVVFDLEELEYVSSAGLRVFLRTYKRVAKEGSMLLVNVQPTVMDVLEASGFAAIFPIG